MVFDYYLALNTIRLKMTEAKMVFKYDFTDDLSLTFFDDQISALWDLNRNFKAIYKGDDSNMPTFSSGIQVSHQPVSYAFKTPFHVERDFKLTLSLEADSVKNIPLVKIGDFGSIVFTQNYMVMSFDRANTTKIVYPTIIHKGGCVSITVGRQGSNYIVVITTSQGTTQKSVEILNPKGFDITGLFGGETIMEMEGTIFGLELFDSLTDIISDETREVEEVDENIKEEQTQEEAIEATDETEDIIKKTEETTDKMTPFDKLLPAEVKLLANYEGLAAAFNIAKPEGSIEAHATESKAYITKFIYYALTALVDYKGQDHNFLYQRAKYIAPMFGKEVVEEELREREYAFKTEKEYDTFDFGRISNANLTNKMLVKLLMEEHGLWKNEIVKL